jgi:hypothetical protein
MKTINVPKMAIPEIMGINVYLKLEYTMHQQKQSAINIGVLQKK